MGDARGYVPTGDRFRRVSAHGEPKPATTIERRCATCGASFLGLAYGKTGLLGIWRDWHWHCSIECHDKSNPKSTFAATGGLRHG